MQDACDRDREEATQHSKKLATCKEREEGYNRMQTNRLAIDAWCQDLPQDDLLQQNRECNDDEHCYPALRDCGKYRQYPAYISADHGDKEKQEEEQ